MIIKKHIRILRVLAVLLFTAVFSLMCACSFDSTETYSESVGEQQLSPEPTELPDIPFNTMTPEPTPEVTEMPTPEPVPESLAVTVSGDALYSNYAYMISMSDGRVLIDKNSGEITYPASITKLMTALVVMRNTADLEEQFTVSYEDVAAAYEAEATIAGFAEGETVSVRELLYGLLLPSGADACNALTRKVAGSEAAFVDIMNQTAAEMGLSNTHFVNATGLHDDMHYSTCRDLSVIFSAALSDPVLREIVCTKTYTCVPTDAHPEGLEIYSTLLDVMYDGFEMSNGAVIAGGKTGTTDEAGRCLASFATYNGGEYMLVTTYAPFPETGEYLNATDAYTAYANLSMQ